MEKKNNNNNNKNVVGHGTSSSSSLDHLFGPRDSSSFSSNNSGTFSSIFPPPSAVLARDQKRIQDLGCVKYEKPENFSLGRKGESSGVTSKDSIYQTETAEQCTFSSSIHYGGQENYSPTTRTTNESPHFIKKDGNDDDPNGNNANSASRGNWWQGSLYY